MQSAQCVIPSPNQTLASTLLEVSISGPFHLLSTRSDELEIQTLSGEANVVDYEELKSTAWFYRYSSLTLVHSLSSR